MNEEIINFTQIEFYLEDSIKESKNSKPVFDNIKREIILTFFLSNPRFKEYVIARLKIVKKVY